MIDGIRADLKAAWHSLWSVRMSTAAAIVTMALGIAAQASTSAVAYVVLVRSLPYVAADRLVLISTEDVQDHEEGEFSYPETGAWIERLRATESAAGYATEEVTVRGVGEPVTARATVVIGPFLRVLGAPLTAGRADVSDTSAVISTGLAERIGVAPSAAIGRTVTAGSRSLLVAGIMSSSSAFPSERTGLWMTAEGMPGIAVFGSADKRRFRILGRLAPEVTIAQARADADRVARETDPLFGHPPGRRRGAVVSLSDTLAAPVRPALRIFFAAGVFVLLIACANVATMLAARAAARKREFAVRIALGAGRWHLLRAFAAEGGTIAFFGVLGGLGLARVSVRIFASTSAMGLPRASTFDLSPHVIGWSIAATALLILVCALLAALNVWRDRMTALRVPGAAGSPGARRMRGVLIVVQLGLAVVLLVGAALLGRTVLELSRTDIGIDPNGSVAVTLLLSERTRFDTVSRQPFLAETLRRVRELPGVRAAGFGGSLPPRFSVLSMGFSTERDGPMLMCDLVPVSPGYLEAIGARLVRGRTLTQPDLDGGPVMVISETIARRVFPDRDPLGRTLFPLPGSKLSPAIVGVVRDIKYSGLEAPAGGAVYVPWTALPSSVMNLVVRGSGDPRALAGSVRRVLRDLDPGLPIPHVIPLTEEISNAFADRRVGAALAASFAAIAIAVALLGLAGSLARLVTERRRELAIRAALGSSPARTTRLVVGQGVRLAAAGIGAGVAAAFGAARLLSSQLYGIAPHDPATFVLVAVFIAAASLVACYLPARRAARIDPLELLRAE